MSIDRYNVLDLTGGIGGISLAFEQSEFDVVCAVEKNFENANIYKELVNNKYLIQDDIMNLNMEELPFADVVTADLTTSFSIKSFEEFYKKPRRFLKLY